MLKPIIKIAAVTTALTAHAMLQAQTPVKNTVTVDNFARAESTRFFSTVVSRGGFGQFTHNRQLVPIEMQPVVRLNRDTLYSSAVFDLDAGPVTVTLPDSGGRYFSMIAINEHENTPGVVYKAGSYTYSKQDVGSRYVVLGVRTMVNPNDAKDVQAAHALQDAIKVRQEGGAGKFEMPAWDPASQDKVRAALLALAATVPDSRGMFGRQDQVDPVRHLLGSAAAWGGNPEKDALYLNITPAQNDGSVVHRFKVKDVPVNAFWSVSVYNGAGYFEKNPYNAYTLNNLTAEKDRDGAVTVQFGGCDGKIANCLPTLPGWNYMVRLYQPGEAILSGTWHFPEATPIR
ncbi:DUF1254 domain-containing protein [Pseudomonas putida]|uniref:DUF1254 domain-containing protein n=1 Tax=Pseudomonas putida TaxID=303 RepID=UPI00236620EB|nr:DUF1254 domain-containing protein [Pseudomonas putida]MDD2050590.1 DUF1254 domain-containing protein [Pseudomonas putida]